MSDGAPRYRILRRLGQGGMAEVFEAELAGQLGFSRKVAIKRMLPEAASDPTIARRFLDEARIASRLHDANIVAVLDVGVLDNAPFQVLEIVDGINVSQLLRRTGDKLPLEVALIITADVAHALDHAHNARDEAGRPLGIVHRDVKPANVLVAWNGDVKLTDFGIAFANDRLSQTEAGSVAGTRGYIAPEQRLKSAIDGRTDVFALGVSLHAMLCGYSPLEDVTVEMACLTGEPLPLDKTLPPDVAALIARAVTPQLRDRFTAVQFADALGAMLAPRLGRDARGYLRDYLAAFREDKPVAGVLDQLLGLDVVLSAAAQGDEPPRYTLRPTAVEKPVRVEVSGEAPTVAERPPPVPAPAPAPSPTAGMSIAETTPAARTELVAPKRFPIAVLATATLGLGLVGWWGTTRLLHRTPSTKPEVPVIATAPAAIDAAVELPPDATVIVDAAPTNEVSVSTITTDGKPDKLPVRRRPDAGVTTAAAPDAPPPPTPTGTGYLQVIGEANIGAKIVVDGRELGYAPDKLEVPRGAHRLDIIRKDGSKVSQSIDVTDYHTIQHPLRPAL